MVYDLNIDEKFRSVILESIGEIEIFLKEIKIRSIDLPINPQSGLNIFNLG